MGGTSKGVARPFGMQRAQRYRDRSGLPRRAALAAGSWSVLAASGTVGGQDDELVVADIAELAQLLLQEVGIDRILLQPGDAPFQRLPLALQPGHLRT